MKGILFLIVIIFYVGLIHGNPPNKKQRTDSGSSSTQDSDACQNCGLPYGDRGVNQGASTSTQGVNRCQRCELQNYANRLVFLMTAEDRVGLKSLIDMMNNRYEEMEAFYEYVNSFITLLGNTNAEEESELERTARLDYLNFSIEELMMQITQVACSGHYKAHVHYAYNSESKKIEIFRTYQPDPNSCVCEAPECKKERSMKNFQLKLPIVKRIEERLTQLTINDELEVEGTMMYYIVPLPLISKFFKRWLEDPTSYTSHHMMPNNNFNDCVDILLKRFKRSVKKLVLVSIKKSQAYSNKIHSVAGSVDEVLTQETLQSSSSWLRGNVIIAPINRGPFAPGFAASGSDLENAYDHEARNVIGLRRNEELLHVFHTLLEFNRLAPQMLPFERLTRGFKAYLTMMLAFTRHGVTPFRRSDWIKRNLSYEEMMEIRDLLPRGLLEREYFEQKFYSTRNLNRKQRSVLLEKIESTLTEEQEFRIQWREFVLDVMKVSMEDRSFNQSLPWHCKFSRLYDQYLLQKSDTFDEDCLNCLDFDEFLFSRILQPNNWTKCSYTINNDVCSAWNNVTEIMNNVSYQINKNHNFYASEYHRLGKSNWKPYLQHMETIVDWLSSPTGIADKKDVKITAVELPPTNMFSLIHHSGIVDITWCVISLFAPAANLLNRGCSRLGKS